MGVVRKNESQILRLMSLVAMKVDFVCVCVCVCVCINKRSQPGQEKTDSNITEKKTKCLCSPMQEKTREIFPFSNPAKTAAAAAAKSLQSCPSLCNPTDGSPPGSAVPGILQARTLEWVAVSFSNA